MASRPTCKEREAAKRSGKPLKEDTVQVHSLRGEVRLTRRAGALAVQRTPDGRPPRC
jgi:hypothetical protein